VGILGLTFKEDVHDIRNSKVPDIVRELNQFGIKPLVHDPLAHAEEARREYGIDLSPLDEFQDLDALVYAVNHARFQEAGLDRLVDCLNPKAVLVDVKSAFAGFHFPHGITYWSL
jgi:UDP-N-acetyl-D-galactosamine dehydrogenase